MALAALLSPLTPVGEARLAVGSPGAVVVDPVVAALGALATAAAVVGLSAWPAVRHARLLRGEPAPRPVPLAPVRAVARIGAPPSITLATVAEATVNRRHVRLLAVTAIHGPALISVVDGRLPQGDHEIMLGAATMRSVGARPGGLVQLAVTDPDGVAHTAQFKVIGRASFPPSFGTGGLGSGAAMTIRALTDMQCPPGGGQRACQRNVQRGAIYSVLARAAPGPAAAAALARHVSKYRQFASAPQTPGELVNFGESVNFPLLLGGLLSLFGFGLASPVGHTQAARAARPAADPLIWGYRVGEPRNSGNGAGENMSKYAIFFSYSSDTWARMISTPGDRSAALRQLLDKVGGSFDSLYWMFGAHDGIAIVDAPDSLSAAAASVAVGSTGAFKHLETHELFTQDQLGEMLARAKNAAQVYQPPGRQG